MPSTSARILHEFEQFFWQAEFLEIEDSLPLGSADVDIWLNLAASELPSLRTQGLARLNAWLLEAVRDFNLPVLHERCRLLHHVANVEIFSRCLLAILHSPSDTSQSAQTRHLLNVVFVLMNFFEVTQFLPSLVRAIHRIPELPAMPVCKFLKIFEFAFASDPSFALPESSLFPDKGEEVEFSVTYPELTTFRSLVLLAKHHYDLVSTHPAQPPAIRLACEKIRDWYARFFSVYRLHAVEVNFLRLEPTMHEAFVFYAHHKNKAQRRTNLFKRQEDLGSLFDASALLKSVAATFSAPATASVSTSPEKTPADTPDDISECSDVSISDNLIEELRCFSDAHFPPELLKDIAVWWDKVVTPPSFKASVDVLPGTAESRGKWDVWIRELIGTFLRIKLSTCRHSVDYPHALSLAQDRLLLHASLELRNNHAHELRKISAEVELRKNADVIAGAVSGILIRALDVPGVGDSVVAHNGLLVFLKYANGFEDTDLAGTAEVSGALSTFIGSLSANRAYLAAFPVPKITALYRTLQLLWKLVKDHPTRVRKFILPFRSVTIMKRLMRCQAYRVQRVVLKLFKVQVRFLPKKLKNMSVKFVSQVFAQSDSSTEPYDDWMLTTSLSVEDNNPTVAVHQGPESVVGETQKQEEFFEVKEDDEYDFDGAWREYSVQDAEHVDWRNPLEVKFFCDRYGIQKSGVFFGYSSFDEWLEQDVLRDANFSDLYAGQ